MRHSRPQSAPVVLVDPAERRYGRIVGFITLACLAVAVTMIGKVLG